MASRTKQVGIGTAIVTIMALLGWLGNQSTIDLTTSGDVRCAGSFEEPCVSYFNVTSKNYTLYLYNPGKLKLTAQPEIRNYYVCLPDKRFTKPYGEERPCGAGYREVDFVTPYFNTTKYVFKFEKGKRYEFKLVAYKKQPTDKVKWGISAAGKEKDPVWDGYSRSSFVKLIENKADITSGYTVYEVCNPTSSDLAVPDASKFNFSFTDAGAKLKGRMIYLLQNKTTIASNRTCNVTAGIKEVASNKTTCSGAPLNKSCSTATTLTTTPYTEDVNCTSQPYNSTVREYALFNPVGKTLKAKTCQTIKIEGSYVPAWGTNQTNIDNVINYAGMKFTEYAAWLTGWDKRVAIWINATNGTRTNYPVGFFEGVNQSPTATCLDVTSLINKAADNSDIRVLDNTTNTTVPFEIMSNTSTSVCIIFLANLTAGTNNSFYVYWNNSAASTLSFTTDFRNVNNSNISRGGVDFVYTGSVLNSIVVPNGASSGKIGAADTGTSTNTGLINGVTFDNGGTYALSKIAGSCSFVGINGSVCKQFNCSSGGIGALYTVCGYTNITRIKFYDGGDGGTDQGIEASASNSTNSAVPHSWFLNSANNQVMTYSSGESDIIYHIGGFAAGGLKSSGVNAFYYWNASMATLYSGMNASHIYTRVANSFGNDPYWNDFCRGANWDCYLPSVEFYVGAATGNTTAQMEQDYYWMENKPIISVSANETFSVAAATCDCPASGNWVISDGSNCALTTTCNIGANKLRITSGKLRIMSGGKLRATGCFVTDAQSLYVDNGGGLYCS